MDIDKTAKFIKELRQQNNISQKQLANKLGVSSQAVSKWENGKNLPDISILKELSEEYNININDILKGDTKNINNVSKYDKNNIKIIIIILSITFIIIPLITITINTYLYKRNDYEFKILSSNCNNFNITGTLAYNNNKSSIYISNVEYCGGNDNTIYKSIDCTLYEQIESISRIINKVEEKNNIKLEEYLQQIEFNINNYSSISKHYNDKKLYLQINATTKDDKTITYKIPLKLSSSCKIK